jgi:aspartate 1-decarboxylase
LKLQARSVLDGLAKASELAVAENASKHHNCGMFRKFLRSKIHRATVTQADLHYEGSLTIPPDLMLAAGIAPFESVHVWDVTRGTRLETYAILGEQGSSDVCINGAAAHLVRPGDVIIIATFGLIAETQNEVRVPEPKVVFVDANNRITHTGREVPGPRRRGLDDAPVDDCC